MFYIVYLIQLWYYQNMYQQNFDSYHKVITTEGHANWW